MVHLNSCSRYGATGDPRKKHCLCSGHVSQAQGDQYVDAGVANWLCRKRKNGNLYRTRNSIVMALTEAAVCQLSERREAEQAIKKSARKKEREETVVPSDAVRLLSRFLQREFSKGCISPECSRFDAQTVLTLLNKPSELAASKLHELHPQFVGELNYVTKWQKSGTNFGAAAPWRIAFDTVCEYAKIFATGQTIGEHMFLSEAEGGKGEIKLLGGRKDNDPISKVLAHDNDGQQRLKAVSQATAYLRTGNIADVFKAGLLQIGRGQNRVRPAGARPDSFTAWEDAYEDNGDQ